MNNKLVRRLRREAAANPGKAGALALVIVVAIWFWAPLVIHWYSPATAPAGEPPAPVAAAVPTAPTNVDGANQNASASAAKAATVPWQQLVKAIDQEPRMQPTQRLVQWRNPFGPSAAAVAAALAKAKAGQQKNIQRAPPRDLLPADAGLVLNSTLIGSGRRMALIGGEPYWEGDVVPASHGSESFRLIEIFARQVVLERAGKHYSLEIKITTHDMPLAGEPQTIGSGGSPQTAQHPKTSMPRSGKAASGKQAPFAKFNAND